MGVSDFGSLDKSLASVGAALLETDHDHQIPAPHNRVNTIFAEMRSFFE